MVPLQHCVVQLLSKFVFPPTWLTHVLQQFNAPCASPIPIIRATETDIIFFITNPQFVKQKPPEIQVVGG